jgi:hypothetical protein
VGGGTFGITAFPAGNIVTVPALMAERRAPGFDLLVPLVDDSDPDAGLVPVPYVTFSTATGQVLEVHGRAAVVAPAFVS